MTFIITETVTVSNEYVMAKKKKNNLTRQLEGRAMEIWEIVGI